MSGNSTELQRHRKYSTLKPVSNARLQPTPPNKYLADGTVHVVTSLKFDHACLMEGRRKAMSPAKTLQTTHTRCLHIAPMLLAPTMPSRSRKTLV